MDDDLLDTAVRRSMRVLVQSEVMGERLFGIVERHARTKRDRRMWGALHALEEQTRAAVFERYGADIDRVAYASGIGDLAGVAGGAGLWLMPRPVQLRSLVLGTKPFVPHFRRLDAHFAGTADAPFFSYVLAHEYAIAESGRRALTQADEALAPVEALLGNVPG
jgi:hypothetical protein